MPRAIRILVVALMIGLGGLQAQAQQTPVLDTRNKTEQCEAIYAWVALTRELAGEKAMTGKMIASRVPELIAPAFADDLFPAYFGKRYFDLSKGDKNKLRKTFQRCSENNYRFWFGGVGVSEAFQTRRDRYKLDEWEAEIAKHPTATALLETRRTENAVEAERERQKEIIRTEKKVAQGNKAGVMLLDKGAYAIHGWRLSNHDFREPCAASSGGVQLAVLLSDPSMVVSNGYIEQEMRNTIIPFAEELCPTKAHRVWANFYFKGVYLNERAQPYDIDSWSTSGTFERPFKQADTNGGSLNIHLFEKHKPDAAARPHYDSLEGLTRLGTQDFMVAADYNAVQAEREAYSKAQKSAPDYAIELAGFMLDGEGGTGLITGFEPGQYFADNRNKIPLAVVGYSVAITQSCPASEIPGGTSEAVLSLSTDREAAGSQTSFLWPADYLAYTTSIVDKYDGFPDYLGYAENTWYYRDIKRIIEERGCGSTGLLNYHRNLLSVAEKYEGNWAAFK